MAGVSGDPIADYLAGLRAGLRTPPARTAEIVAEAEDHLRESAAAVRQAGHLSETAAQQAAIEAFGPVRRIVRAHRPPVTAFAAAAGLRAWPLLPAYVLLSALMGALLLWLDIVTNHGHSLVPVVTTDHLRRDQKTIVFLGIGTPSPGQAAAVFGGCVLAGVLLVIGFLIVRRHGRRSGLVFARLPRGLVPVAAAIGLLAFGFGEGVGTRSYGLGWLPAMTGSYELVIGSQYVALLMGVGCALWALGGVVGDSGETGGHLRARRLPASAYAVEAGLKACQLLGGYLLLSALMGVFLLYLEVGESPVSLPDPGRVAAAFGGCVLAGVLLIAGITTVRQRRLRLGLAPARPSRGLSLLASVIALLALAFAEYRFYAGDVMGTLHVADGIADLILGSQWAAVLMGAGWALRTLLSLVRWALPGRRAGNQAPPGNADLAPV